MPLSDLMFFVLVVNALNCGYFLGLNPVVRYSFHKEELDIRFFVPLRVATVLRAQHGVLALFVLPAVGFSSFSNSQLLWTSMPLAEFVVCHGQARVRVTLPPNPLHPGHDPAVGWAIFFRNDIFASFIFGLDFATRFSGRWRLR